MVPEFQLDLRKACNMTHRSEVPVLVQVFCIFFGFLERLFFFSSEVFVVDQWFREGFQLDLRNRSEVPSFHAGILHGLLLP